MEQELLAVLLSAAISLSGLPALNLLELPPILRLSHENMTKEVCPLDPASCRGMVAFFDADQQRILIDDSLDLALPEGSSFVVHELVHVLQFSQRGERMYEDCEESVKTEAQAYQVQNAYLKKEGRLLRLRQRLAFASCSSAARAF